MLAAFGLLVGGALGVLEFNAFIIMFMLFCVIAGVSSPSGAANPEPRQRGEAGRTPDRPQPCQQRPGVALSAPAR